MPLIKWAGHPSINYIQIVFFPYWRKRELPGLVVFHSGGAPNFNRLAKSWGHSIVLVVNLKMLREMC